MKIIAIILIAFGSIALLISLAMFGDIGIAAAIGAITAILCGVGFLQVNKALNTKEN